MRQSETLFICIITNKIHCGIEDIYTVDISLHTHIKGLYWITLAAQTLNEGMTVNYNSRCHLNLTCHQNSLQGEWGLTIYNNKLDEIGISAKGCNLPNKTQFL